MTQGRGCFPERQAEGDESGLYRHVRFTSVIGIKLSKLTARTGVAPARMKPLSKQLSVSALPPMVGFVTRSRSPQCPTQRDKQALQLPT